MSEPNRTKMVPCESCGETGLIACVGRCKDCGGLGYIVETLTCWSCKKPLTEPLDLDLAELPNRGKPMCGPCRGQDAD